MLSKDCTACDYKNVVKIGSAEKQVMRNSILCPLAAMSLQCRFLFLFPFPSILFEEYCVLGGDPGSLGSVDRG